MRPPHLLEHISKICLSLPEATREDMGAHAAFAVRKKKFAYYLHDHHGDGIISVSFKTASGENPILIDSDPDLYYSPAYLGPRGWVALRLDLGEIDWEQVTAHLIQSYRLTAPKRLASRLDEPPG